MVALFTARSCWGALGMAWCCAAYAQVVFPTSTQFVRDVAWTTGTHHLANYAPIHAPGDPVWPTHISEEANAEFVSGTEVRLTDGFHAGSFFGEGQFRARIGEQFGDPESIVLIPSDPGAQLMDGVVHVPKWEKLEIGIELPQVYKDAIDNFFGNYYSNGPDEPATSGAIDPVLDLNPYADDSLQLVMTLTKPSGTQTLKWGFFMREAEWTDDGDFSVLREDHLDPLSAFNIRFRLSPDEEGVWGTDVSIKAPFTQDGMGTMLPTILYSNHVFTCGPPLPDNHGPLHVNPENRRVLQFEDGTSFFGLGPNMADKHGSDGTTLFRRDLETMKGTMEELHAVGGNFMRMWLLREVFSPEQINLGVYDAYRYKKRTTCTYESEYVGNGQFNCWAFDQMVDQARANEIMIQLCIHPYAPATSMETYQWNSDPLYISFLNGQRHPETQRFDMKDYFYTPDPLSGTRLTDEGAFYFWKRRYKYVLSRWGYSMNIPIIEPFNEIDQTLTYQYNDLTGHSDHDNICTINQREWPLDPQLPQTLNDWITDISSFVRDEVIVGSPLSSPLGESKKLFLMSFTDASTAADVDHYLPFTNPKVDLMSVHKYAWSDYDHTPGQPDPWVNYAFDHVQDFRQAFPSTGATFNQRKPFTQGELNYWTTISGHKHIEMYFHNYDVSFHNELWASAFSGKFATGTSWIWHRIFWWPDAVPAPPEDPNNEFQWSVTQQFSNVLGDENELVVDNNTIYVKNKRLHHHFKPLSDLLHRPSVVDLGIFSGNYTPGKFFDPSTENPDPIECYYLRNDLSTAIGWVHNRNAWVMNSYYLASGGMNQNFLGCTAPTTASITLSGFFSSHPHYITWFPTRIGATDLPPDSDDSPIMSNVNGEIMIDLSGHFNGIADNYLDTLHSDYAFVITPAPFVKSLQLPPTTEAPSTEASWDFELFPNPTRDMLYLRFRDEAPKDISVLDVSGRPVASQTNITATAHYLPLQQLAKGAYWVRVTDGRNMKSKKLIIH